jgi:hypothetical protein
MWLSRSQYYLFVHKQPHLLHLFYNKASTLIRGTEGEDNATCYGQKVCFPTSLPCSLFIKPRPNRQSSTSSPLLASGIPRFSSLRSMLNLLPTVASSSKSSVKWQTMVTPTSTNLFRLSSSPNNRMAILFSMTSSGS